MDGKQAKFLQYDNEETTDNGGFFSVTMTDPYKVISAWADQGDRLIIPFAKTGVGNIDGNITWWFKVLNDSMTPRTSYVISFHFLYINT